jgi:hypothetical protein
MDKQIITSEDFRKSLREAQSPARMLGDFYLTKNDTGQVGIAISGEAAIDPVNMTAKVPISTEDLDRVNHVVVQSGIKLAYYERNPVVLYNHGESGITEAIALSKRDNEPLSIGIENGETFATAYFNPRLPLSVQYFALVEEKFLRSASVGISPIVVSKGYTNAGEEVLFIEECVLNEWSFVTLPCNPFTNIQHKNLSICRELRDLQSETANRILTKGLIEGTRLLPVIEKQLRSVITIKPSTPGFTEDKKNMKTTTKDALKKLKRKEFLAEFRKMAEYDEPSQKIMEDVYEENKFVDDVPPKSDDLEVVKEVSEEDMPASDAIVTEDHEPVMKLGAQVLRNAYTQLKAACDITKEALGPVEAMDVKEQVSELMEQVSEVVAAMEAIYSEKYADQPKLVPDESEMKMAEEEMKSFLGSSVARPRAVEAYSKRLSQVLVVAKKLKMPAADLALLSTTAKDLQGLASQAKSYKPDNSKVREEIRAELDKEYAVKFEKLETKLGEVMKAFSEAPKPIAR